MAGSSYRDDDPIIEINVTPLVDVVLVLLIVFLATSYLIAQQSFKVELPKASQTVATEARTIAIVVQEDGAILLDGQPISPESLEAGLAARVKANPRLQVVVGADEQVAHGRVVTVMDVARRAGVEKLAFAVDRP